MAKKSQNLPAGAVRITSTLANFRRAGIAHPAEATTYPAGTFTEEQLQQLKAEPKLVVEEIGEVPLALETDDGKGGKGGKSA